MKALATANRFGSFGTASILSLVVAGYLALAGSAFWAFTNQSAGGSQESIEPYSEAPTALVCDCQYEKPTPAAAPRCAAN
jgi:hypothetical protein